MTVEERARLSTMLSEFVAVLVELVSADVAERLRPQLGELATRSAAPAPSGRSSRPPERPSRPARPDDLLTIAEAAAVINVSPQTVKFWVFRARSLPHVSVGPRTCRIRRADLEALIQGGPRDRAHEPPSSTPAQRERLERTLQRRCAECLEVKHLRAFGRPDGDFDTRCQECRRRNPVQAPAPVEGPSKVVDLSRARQEREP